MRRWLNRFLIAGLLATAAPAFAQVDAQTLADIKAELGALSASITALRQELVTTGASGAADASGSALARMDAIEAELTRLTGKTEELENRINRVVDDGTLRINDLQFRLTELEGGDPVAAGDTPRLGGDVAPAPDPAVPDGGAVDPAPELAINEQSDFDRAKAALDSGSFRSAADLFAAFTQTYTGGSLTAEAQYLRGEALLGLGETKEAARAYLDSFSGSPSGPVAADALYKVGLSLSQLGQMQDACVTLGEVGRRFPDAAVAADAAREMQALQCQ
jgi:tol-pal system protein YbgF